MTVAASFVGGGRGACFARGRVIAVAWSVAIAAAAMPGLSNAKPKPPPPAAASAPRGKHPATTTSAKKPAPAASAKPVRASASARSDAQRPSHRRGTTAVDAANAGAVVQRVSAVDGALAGDYLHRPDVLAYIDSLVASEGFDRDALLRLFADVRYSATAARLMAPAPPSSGATRGDWNAYRARFVEPVRLAAGFRFWDDNAELLARAERDFGVPPEIVVGILGVETVYGRNTGGFRVLDALTTLAFDYPNRQRDRSAFFLEQLGDALRLGRDGAADLSTLRGSYAGAIGMPQFMPGSIRQFAVDYDGDGRIDLVGSTADVVGSVANFLSRHGWVRGERTHLPLGASSALDARRTARIAEMVDAGSAPTFAYADLVAAGLSTTAVPVEPLALIDLPSGVDASGQPVVTYLAGTRNFHAITRYNRSYFYAFSVIELGSTIRALRDVRP